MFIKGHPWRKVVFASQAINSIRELFEVVYAARLGPWNFVWYRKAAGGRCAGPRDVRRQPWTHPTSKSKSGLDIGEVRQYSSSAQQRLETVVAKKRSVRWLFGLVMGTLICVAAANLAPPVKLTKEEDHKKENDGSSEHVGNASRQERQRRQERSELRQLRRSQGESVSRFARFADAEEREKGHEGIRLVEQAEALQRPHRRTQLAILPGVRVEAYVEAYEVETGSRNAPARACRALEPFV